MGAMVLLAAGRETDQRSPEENSAQAEGRKRRHQSERRNVRSKPEPVELIRKN
jgi:hypothetical protein